MTERERGESVANYVWRVTLERYDAAARASREATYALREAQEREEREATRVEALVEYRNALATASPPSRVSALPSPRHQRRVSVARERRGATRDTRGRAHTRPRPDGWPAYPARIRARQ